MSTTFASPEIRAAVRLRLGQLGGVALAVAALLLLLALVSYSPRDPSFNTATAGKATNWVGIAGATTADLLLQAVGLAALLPVLSLIAWAWRLFNSPRAQITLRCIATLLALPAVAGLLSMLPGASVHWPTEAGLGGAIGAALADRLLAMGNGLLGATGGPVVASILGAMALILVFLSLGLTGSEWRTAGRGARTAAGVSIVSGRAAVRGSSRIAASLVARTGQRSARAEPELDWQFEPEADGPAPTPPDAPPMATVSPVRPAARVDVALLDPVPTKPKVNLRKPEPPVQTSLPLVESGWQFPPLSLLRAAPAKHASGPSEDALQANARLLESVLSDYGVQGTIREIRPGPVVTLYELEPAPGIRSARVIGLADDVARSLSVTAVRIATVSGRNVIGIEVPNDKRETVYLSELLDSGDWHANTAKLPLALGKDISGAPIIADLARMPHLLIAGTTGSGKSVGINAMILSILYRMSPDQCRLIMIDPKMLELSVYEGIPHLLAPVVTEPAKAVAALKWTTREMERRYRAMSQLGVRNVGGYNDKVAEALATGKVPTRQVQVGFDEDTHKPIYESQPLALNLLPYIVVVIDEMADLMMVAGKEVEAAVQRLAQMARAAGIHVIMATQRPSVDVITGTIKANFPTRISFQVISKFDSRTILGEQGAEQLLGMGDLLHMAGGGRISRVHGPFVADNEVEQIVEFLRGQADPAYDDEVTDGPDESGSGSDGSNAALSGIAAAGDSDKSLFDQAVAFVSREGKASTSLIQRHLRIGYNRAATLIEQMEKEGIVSPANHVGRREVLCRVTRDDDD
ncbi:MAG: DNA translocase FtsK 4TM domain-containing protein [Acetobacteraceae bacterium]|nr:DNA translocase FtsK 4TM domain-containing protein [Acetobacteraceae bacterium]